MLMRQRRSAGRIEGLGATNGMWRWRYRGHLWATALHVDMLIECPQKVRRQIVGLVSICLQQAQKVSELPRHALVPKALIYYRRHQPIAVQMFVIGARKDFPLPAMSCDLAPSVSRVC